VERRRLRSAGLIALLLLAPTLALAQGGRPASDDEIQEPFAPPKKKKKAPPKEVPKEPPKEEEEASAPEAEQEKPEADPSSLDRKIAGDTELRPDQKPKSEPLPEAAKISRIADPALNEPDVDPNADERSLRARIEARAKMVRTGDYSSADQEISVLIDIERALGIRNLPLVSSELVEEARLALERGEVDRANLLAVAASQISPDLVEAHRMRVRAALGYGATGTLLVIDALQGLGRVHFRGFRNQIELAMKGMVVLGLALLGMIVVFASIQFLKHLRYAAHDMVRPFGDWLTEVHGASILLLFVAAPFLLGYGLVTTI
jgi:hypothetical protein